MYDSLLRTGSEQMIPLMVSNAILTDTEAKQDYATKLKKLKKLKTNGFLKE